MAGTGLFLAVIGMLGVAVGALVRSTTAGVAVMVALMFVLPGLGPGPAVVVAGSHAEVLAHPGGRADAQCRPSGPRPGPWAGLGLLVGFTALVGLAATVRFVHAER